MILHAVRPLTMVSDIGIKFSMNAVVTAIRDEVPGEIVECGVWRGGCAIAMLLAQRREFKSVLRPVHLLDSFQGLPPAGERDGPAARAWQADVAGPSFHNNCRATADEVMDALEERFDFRVGRDAVLWPGWFRETLPHVLRTVHKIAVLRIDCDWYAPTRECLDALLPLVSEGGTVIFDDYYAWDGAARAVHDHLSERDIPLRIRSLADGSAAYATVTR